MMPLSKLRTSNVGFLLLTSVLVVVNNPACANDLLGVYSQAEINNLELQSSVIDAQIAQEGRNEIAADFGSSLSLNFKPSYSFGEEEIPDRASVDYSLSFNKPLYQQQLNERLSQADLTIQREQVVLSSQKQLLISQIAKAYIDFASAQSRLKMSLSEQEFQRQNLNQVNALLKKEEVTASDVTETQLTLNQSLINVSEANLELSNARRELFLLTGKTYSALKELDETSVLPPLQPTQVAAWSKLASENNPELLLARLEHDIQKQETRIEATADSTTLDLFASFEGEEGVDDKTLDSRIGKVGLEINIPLYSGGRTLSKVRNAKLQQQKTHLDMSLKMREVEQNVHLEFLTVQAGLANLRALKRASIEASKILVATKRAKAAGTLSETDVITYSQDALAAKRSYLEARYKYLGDLVDLKLSAGVLSVSDLRTMNAFFGTSQAITAKAAVTAKAKVVRTSHQGLTLEDVWK